MIDMIFFNPPSRFASDAYAKASATACGREGVVKFPAACCGYMSPELALGYDTIYRSILNLTQEA